MIRPPLFGKTVAADARRQEFDWKNAQILSVGKRPRLVLIGDSITHFWEESTYFDGFVVNRGIGGDTTEYLTQRFEADALQLKPEHIAVLIGVNDLFAMAYDHWNRKEGMKSAAVEDGVIKNITKMANTGGNLILCSILPTRIAQPYDRAAWNRAIVRLNGRIKAVCEENGLRYADYHAKLCEEDCETLRKGLSQDGIHPNETGYEIMAATLRRFIEPV